VGYAHLPLARRQLCWSHLRRDFQAHAEGLATEKEFGEHGLQRHCRGMARNLLKAWPALWAFATHDGVEPTNNHAERSLRGAVIYRKLSLGSQSEQGERRIERLLSASITCRLQHRSLFAYMTELLNAHARDDPTPTLA
jgi:transposase